MSDEISLQEEIEAVIQPWHNEVKEPPFTVGELITMALILRARPMTQRNIMEWISTTFKYYSSPVLSAFWENEQYPGYRSGLRTPAQAFKDDFKKAFLNFDLPVIEVIPQVYEARYSTNAREGRVYLAKHIEPIRRGAFPFLRLPAELRIAIYEMCFSYPHRGICLTPYYDDRKIEMRVPSRAFPLEFSFQAWKGQWPQLKLQPSLGAFSLLAVNKQINKEAKSCFFRINTFYFTSLYALDEALIRIPKSLSQHIGHIAFKYDRAEERSSAPNAIEKLAAVNNLDKLDIYLSEDQWVCFGESPTNTDRMKLRGFAMFSKMRGLKEVNFHGDCSTIAAILKPKMETPLSVQEANKRKRNALGPERKQPARAAKAQKTIHP